MENCICIHTARGMEHGIFGEASQVFNQSEGRELSFLTSDWLRYGRFPENTVLVDVKSRGQVSRLVEHKV